MAGLFLRANPRAEIFCALHRYAQKHLGVLRAAVLRALAKKGARLFGIHPHLVNAIRNQVGFPRKLGNPEAVVGVGGKQLQIAWAVCSPEDAIRSR